MWHDYVRMLLVCLLGVECSEPLEECRVGVMESRVEGICYGKGEVVLVEFDESRAKWLGMTQSFCKAVCLVLASSNMLGHQKGKHLQKNIYVHWPELCHVQEEHHFLL